MPDMTILTTIDPIHTDEGAQLQAWTDGWAVGYRVTLPDSTVRYIYLNPSSGDGDADDPAPAVVFLYVGENGDPAQDAAHHHYEVRG